MNADKLKSRSLNACKFYTSKLVVYNKRSAFRLNNWNSVASFDAVQIAKITFFTFQQSRLGPQFAGIVKSELKEGLIDQS